MVTRIITAIVALLLFLPLIIWGGIWGAGIIFAIISGFSVYEMVNCCGLLKKWYLSIPAILFSTLITLLPIMIGVKGDFGRFLLTAGACLAGIMMLLLCIVFVAVVAHKTIDTERLMMFFIMSVYITAGFCALSVLRVYYGLWSIAFVLSIAWVTDTMAYFSGMLFGKKKLCPNISPKKTIAGAIGGTLFGTVVGALIFWSQNAYTTQALLLGLIALPLSIMSQFGDLFASVIKRRFGVKDYGKIFPGHGGVLDRFDSIIPVSMLATMIFILVALLNWL